MLCIPKEQAEKIKRAIISGRIAPDKLQNMTSVERRTFLEQLVGENARDVNLLFEKKLLLKNQERAMYDWAKEITGLSKAEKEATLNKIRETYAEKARRTYNPKENEMTLSEIISDIYSKKFNTDISLKEAEIITELSKDVITAKEKIIEDADGKKSWATKQDGLDFGTKKVAMDNYTGELRRLANRREWINLLKAKNIKEIGGALLNNSRLSFNFIADNSRAIVASVDNSLWGRQGWGAIFNNPLIWAKNFAKSWIDIYKVFIGGNKAGDAIIDGTKAEIYSRNNYLNDRYAPKGEVKLDIGVGEEEFPTSAPSKIPALGRIFRMAEVAYEAGAMRLRADIADKLYDIAERGGIDLTDVHEVGSINELVNSMTGRGRFGKRDIGGGAQKFVNKTFFSIKFLKSEWDTLTLHAGSTMSTFARTRAGINWARSISGVATILGTASALFPGSVESNPTSSDFGTIKAGNTRYDVTGGRRQFVILLARLIASATGQSVKSSLTGTQKVPGGEYGAPDGLDFFWNFTENKFSPMFSVIKELVNRKTFEGSKPTLTGELLNLTTPMVIEQGLDASKSEAAANVMLAVIADAIGVSANTYIYNVDWNYNPSKELKQFKEEIGQDKFNEANKKYNNRTNAGLLKLHKSEEWIKMTNDEKTKEITKMKTGAKKDIFIEYNFKYLKNK